MNIDQFSISLITALVVVVCGGLFLVETMLRRDLAAARLWSVGYVGAMVTTLLYLAWAWAPQTWWAVAAGNAAFVLGTGFMWLGCRRFNAHTIVLPMAAVLVAAVVTGGAAAASGPRGGDWSGGPVMFLFLAVFAALASWECFRGDLGRTATATILGLVFGLEAAFMAGRLITFLAAGPDSAAFRMWFGTFSASALTVVLMITAVVATSVLRAGRAGLRGSAGDAVIDEPVFAIRSAASLADALAQVRERAARRGETACVASVRLEDLDEIRAAFGAETRERLVQVWRRTLLDEAPTLWSVGSDGAGGLAAVGVVRSAGEGRRVGMSLYRALFDALGHVGGGVLPAIGVGIALDDGSGATAQDMLARAGKAAARAATSVSATVLLAEADG